VSLGPVGCWLETDPANPLHPFPADELGAAWPDIHLRTTPQEFSELSLHRWNEFALKQAEPTQVVESFPFQSSIRVLMQMNGSRETIDKYWSRWQSTVAALNPVLIFLEEANPRELITKAFETRGPVWTDYFLQSVEQMPFASTRQLEGMEAAVGLLTHYNRLINELASAAPFPVLTCEARPSDYAERQARVNRYLNLENV